MTVRRHVTIDLNDKPPAVAAVVKSVLARNSSYRWSTEIEPERAFKTNVKPSWWLLGTDMTIKLHPAPDGTTMDVRTKSQWFILGDVFGYYNRYISEFALDVRKQLDSTNASS